MRALTELAERRRMSAHDIDLDPPVVAEPIVVAIDGPSGSGKSTISRHVAVALGTRYLDTGAMYRAATWWVLERGIDPSDPAEEHAVVDAVRGLVLVSGTDPRSPSIELDVDGGPVDLTQEVRSAAVTKAVSAVSAIPAVREFLVDAQRVVIDGGNIVVEGRDIGTTVWPAAAVKIFLTASADARAQRRSAEGAPSGTARPAENVAEVRADLARRDRIDSTRAVSPLAQAVDAHVVDSTGLEIPAVVEQVLELVRARTGIGSGDDQSPRPTAEPFQRTVTLGTAGPARTISLDKAADSRGLAAAGNHGVR
jgi:cytidylate kinase